MAFSVQANPISRVQNNIIHSKDKSRPFRTYKHLKSRQAQIDEEASF